MLSGEAKMEIVSLQVVGNIYRDNHTFVRRRRRNEADGRSANGDFHSAAASMEQRALNCA
jgi:hypothetical protein